MRITKFLLKSGLILLGLALVGALLGREILLFLGVNQIESSLSVLRRAAVSGSYYEQCQRKGAVPLEGENVAILQLRFTSPRTYQVEVLCSQYSFDPVVLKKETLPLLVKKVDGAAGIIWGQAVSGVKLEIFGRQAAVGVADGQVVRLDKVQHLGLSPDTTCAGLGFSCCQLAAEVGRGQQVRTVTDCPKTCYQSCERRPVILAFRSKPAPQSNDLVEVRAGEEVVFSYVLDAPESLEVRIDYGDGQSQALTEVEGQFRHVYQCQKAECRYRVELAAETETGIQSAALPINKLQIVVK